MSPILLPVAPCGSPHLSLIASTDIHAGKTVSFDQCGSADKIYLHCVVLSEHKLGDQG